MAWTRSQIRSSLPWIIFISSISFIVFLHFYFLAPGVDAGIHMYGSYLLTKGFLPFQALWNNKPPLIYFIGTAGFLLQSNPFLGVRILELLIFFLDLYLIHKIVKAASLGQSLAYLITFSVIYPLCWDQGFLTETFVIPIVLLTLHLFLQKNKYFEFTAALLTVLAFLLKQNAVIIVVGILAIDLFSHYRSRSTGQKAIKYLISLAVYSGLVFLLLNAFGIWEDFYDQVFAYNSRAYAQIPFVRLVVDHLRHNSFLSYRGISAVAIFNVSILITAWNYWKRYRRGESFAMKDHFLLASIGIYAFAYYFVYISGKTYPHYFMLLLVPAIFIMGYYVRRTIAGRLALCCLFVIAIYANLSMLNFDREVELGRKEVARYIHSHSTPEDRINIDRFGNQYLYVMADRLCNSKFIVPLLENNGYTDLYKKIIKEDFADHPPHFVVVNNMHYRPPDPANFYTQILSKTMQDYVVVFENSVFKVYGRK